MLLVTQCVVSSSVEFYLAGTKRVQQCYPLFMFIGGRGHVGNYYTLLQAKIIIIINCITFSATVEQAMFPATMCHVL